MKQPPVGALPKHLIAKRLPLQVRMKQRKQRTGRRKKKTTSPGGQTEGYWQSQGYNPADVAYIMAFGITALLTTVVVVVEVVVFADCFDNGE